MRERRYRIAQSFPAVNVKSEASAFARRLNGLIAVTFEVIVATHSGKRHVSIRSERAARFATQSLNCFSALLAKTSNGNGAGPRRFESEEVRRPLDNRRRSMSSSLDRMTGTD